MKKNYIIDGFNLGFKIPGIAHWLRCGDTDRAIQLIINDVQRRFFAAANQIIIVFDGKYPTSQILPAHSGIQIKFSRKPQTADDIIRTFIRTCKDPGSWTVISSDAEIRSTAKAMGSVSEKSEAVLKSEKKIKKRPDRAIREKYDPNSVDVEYWLKQFGSGEDD